MQFAITGSSAIENISVLTMEDSNADNIVNVTFSGGRDYDYTVNDVASFVSALSNVIESKGSVGQFVNTAIRNETLQKVAA